MRSLILAGALALAGGLGFAAPAQAGYYDAYGNYHPTVSDYRPYRHLGSMNRFEIRQALRSQGYYGIRNLRRIPVSDRWVATAVINGDLVRVTVDGDDGRVLFVNEI